MVQCEPTPTEKGLWGGLEALIFTLPITPTRLALTGNKERDCEESPGRTGTEHVELSGIK